MVEMKQNASQKKFSKGQLKLIAVASAPVKAIISGEHGVVHGTPGITLTFEPANKVELYEGKGAPSLHIESDRGKVVLDAQGKIIEGGEFEAVFAPFIALVRKMMEWFGFQPNKKLVAKIISANAPKGMGNSASIAAALVEVLFHSMHRTHLRARHPEHDSFWSLVQVAEEIAHGGRPSGIDAMSVCYGPTKLSRVAREGKISWNFEPKHSISAPSGTKFLFVDTHTGGERAKTGDMVKLFAQNSKLLKETGEIKNLLELSKEDKGRLGDFFKVFEEIVVELHPKGDAKKLGAALRKNHLLLSKFGVSTKEIDEVVEIAEKNGAYGAKLTGAGGKGGAVIILAPENDAKMRAALEKAGYKIFEARASPRGTILEKHSILETPHVRQMRMG